MSGKIDVSRPMRDLGRNRLVAIGRCSRLARMAILLASAALFAVPGAADEATPAGASPGKLEFVGRNLLAKAKGTFHEWRIVEASVDLDAIEDAYAVVEVSLDSVDTGIKRRDAHLRDPDFFETETYPFARVRVHSPKPIEDASTDDRRFTVEFDIDLHGVQKTLPGEVRLIAADPVVFEGDLTIDRTDFGVGAKPSRWNPMSPKAEIPVHFRIAVEALRAVEMLEEVESADESEESDMS